jgi:hypothetical protein
MNIGIFINNTEYGWGPGKLALNTIKGFDKFNFNYKINEFQEYNLCICGAQFNYHFVNNVVKKSIIGPCSIGEPLSHINTINSYPKTLVASEWVKNAWVSWGAPEEKLSSWFGGIDVDLFNPKKNIKYDCLILFKQRGHDELNLVQTVLKEKGLSYLELTYGNYTQENFIDTANSCKFCIILHNTETQGFATMEIMSMDLPVLIFDYNTWNGVYPDATSAPYFKKECGIIVHQSQFNLQTIEQKLNELLDNIDSYTPRDVILNNYTIDHSIRLLEKFFLEL